MVVADYCKAFDMVDQVLINDLPLHVSLCILTSLSEKNWEFFLREMGTSEHRLLHVSSSEIPYYRKLTLHEINANR